MHQIPTAPGPMDILKLARPGAGPSGEMVARGFQDLMNAVASAPADKSQPGELFTGSQEGGNTEAVTALLFKRVSSLLETALEVSEAIEAGTDPDQISELKTEFSAALLQLASDLQDVSLDLRLEVAAQVFGDRDVNLDFAPLIQILEEVNPLEALRQLVAKSLKVFSERVTTEGTRAGSVVALPEQAPTGSKFVASAAVPNPAIKGLSLFSELTVKRAPNGGLMSLIEVPPQEPAARTAAVQAATLVVPTESKVSELPAQGVDKIDSVAGGGTAALFGLGKQKKSAAQSSAGLSIDASKAGASSQAVGLTTQLGQAVEGAEARASNSLDAPARTQASADPSASYMFARNVAAQIRGRNFEEGKTRIELSPRGLGDVEVEVARDDSGRLRVVLRVENPAVLTAFRQDREALLAVLREGGFEIEESELAFEEFDGHGFQQKSQESHAPLKPRNVPESATSIEQTQDVPLPRSQTKPAAPSGLNIVT